MVNGTGRILCFDSENMGFIRQVVTRNHCHVIFVTDADTNEPFLFFDDPENRVNSQDLGSFEENKCGTYEDGVRFLSEAKCIIIQNGVGYDFHIFEKHYSKYFNKQFPYFDKTGDPAYPYRVMDTYTMSCTLNPERKVPPQAYALGMGNVGAHSIAAHGIRMGRHKPEHEDWEKLTDDMIHRVMEDVAIGLDFYFYLMKEWKTHMNRPHPITGYNIMNAYHCELRVAMAMARQALRGFAFDVGYAGEMLRELDPQLEETERMFRPHMPMRIKKKKTKPTAAQYKKMEAFFGEHNPLLAEYLDVLEEHEYRVSEVGTQWTITNKWTKKGSKITAAVTKIYPDMRGYLEDLKDPEVVGAFTPIRWEDIPLGNRDSVKQVLYPHGWRGVEFNDTEQDYIDEYGELPKPWSGKINEKSIELWQEQGNPPEWALGIANWYILESRRTQILNKKDVEYYKENGKFPRQTSKKNECRGLLPKCICQETGITAEEYFIEHGMFPDSGHWRIPAVAFHAATNTFRMRHKNVVNIPSRGLYGKQMRRLFIAKQGCKVLGCDGAGLELRMLAHFMGDDDYIDTVLNGDIHTYNQKMAGLPKRDMAKTFIYAFLYGSGIPNLAAVCGVDKDTMGKKVAQFKRKLPKLTALLEGVERVGEQYGYLLSLDGRWGRIRASGGKLKLHTALNVLLQMTGSIIMKYGHIIAEDMAVEQGFIETVGDFPIVAHVHDEAQMEVDEERIIRIEYELPKSEWDIEEKKEFEKEGKIYSAPTILQEEGDTLLIGRSYHPLGHCYAMGLRKAGEMFNMRIPLAGEYMIGDSWLETH
jgi:hypothetical protein